MYYRLQDDHALRGWEKMNTVLIRRPRNIYKPLKPEEFNLLMLCDGETELADIPLTEAQKSLLEEYLEKGTLVQLTEPKPLLEDQIYRYYPNRFVRSCFWSVTGRCNFKCRHCYMDAPEGTLGELSHEEAMELIDQMADCGVLRVDITGGEALVRRDFWQLVDHILSYRMTIGQLYTNGWLLNEGVLDGFEKRGLKPEISISFDGIGWHDWMRGVNGAEQAALKALSLCKKRGFPMNVEMCVHKGNRNTLRETVNRLAEIGVPALRFGFVSETELWKKNSEGNSMSRGEYLDAMIDYIPQFFADGMPMNLLMGGVAELKKSSREYKVVSERYSGTEDCLNCHLCGATRYSCYITPEGRLLPCMPMTACKEQEMFARFQDIGLRAGLSESFYMQFVDKRVRDLLAANEKCDSCKYKYNCGGGCRAAALQQTGDLLGADMDLCFQWENGYVEKIHKVADEAIEKYCGKEDAENEG